MKTNLPPRIEQNLESQVRVATRLREQAAVCGPRPIPFVTISRQFGCEAMALAESLAHEFDALEKLDSGSWQVYGRKLIEAMADQQYSFDQLMSALDSKARSGIEEFVETLVGQISDLRLLHKLVQAMRATATLGRCIIVGRGGAIMTRDLPGGLHVRLVASEEHRLKGLVERSGWPEVRAHAELKEQDSSRQTFYRKYLRHDSNDPVLYDLVLNSERLSQAEQVAQIVALFQSRRSLP
ncbi:MAG: cytidylate kinase-like family protein [bacterium]|nr:cytidylate kinase-like family protein [bacterium]